MKQRKGWRMNCDVGKATEGLENELCRRWSDGNELSSFSKLSVTSPTSQLIFQPFLRFTYVTDHSPTLPLLHLRHSSFSNPSFASPMLQALHLIHLASRPCLANWAIRSSPKLTARVKCEFHDGFWPDQRSGNPNHPSPASSENICG